MENNLPTVVHPHPCTDPVSPSVGNSPVTPLVSHGLIVLAGVAANLYFREYVPMGIDSLRICLPVAPVPFVKYHPQVPSVPCRSSSGLFDQIKM